MDERIKIDDRLASFYDKLYADDSTVEACKGRVAEALAEMADSLRPGRIELTLDSPVSALRPSGAYQTNVLYDRKDGTVCEECFLRVYPVSDGGQVRCKWYPYGEAPFSEEEQKVLHMISKEIFQQFSRAILQNLLAHVMQTDMATGVANQAAFMGYAAKLFAQRKLDGYAILFFNIHNFKYVNKVFPYDEGDKVLKKYACEVNSYCQEEEKLARLGGDNFVMLVKMERLPEMLEKLQNVRLFHETPRKSKNFVFGATIGYSELNGITRPQDVMARASIAYQAARLKGTGVAVKFSDDIQKIMMQNQSIIANFMAALEEREFQVYYQPKVNIKNQTICGAEALVRWQRDGKLISPMQFIPQLEREGSIIKLDYYMLEEVCRFLRKWMDEGHAPICISVNFSRKHLDEDDMVEHIVSILDEHGIAHQYIEIELTESEDFQNYEIMTNIVNELSEAGIGTSMDDFGTGFSSLNMIKKLDLKVIKIDRSFIPLETDYSGKDKDMIMFCNIVTLLRELGKKTIAEGVETQQQLRYLENAGCDIVQGYLLDKPLCEADFRMRLENGYGSC